MTGSSFLNAFKVLQKKPAVLLLLFPIHAFAAFVLLLFPLLPAAGAGDTAGAWIALAILLGFFGAILYLIARSVLLISPAMELLRHGAAGRETPRGWYLRGLKKNWWKRIALGGAECSISWMLSMIAQVAMMVPMLVMIPVASMGSSGNFGFMITVMLLIYALMFLISLVSALVMFGVESLSAYLLAAFADRDFASSFKAVFSKAGRRKFYQLLGGRFLIMLLAAILIAFLAFGGVFIAALLQAGIAADGPGSFFDDGPVSYQDSYAYDDPAGVELFSDVDVRDMLPAALIISACWFFYSLVEIYRFAYEFCVFQEYKNAEQAQADAAGPSPAPLPPGTAPAEGKA